MKDRKKNLGFTLIELLVVIAIIAILVVIVIVAINPAERLRDASDQRASHNVSASGTLVASCIARNQGNYNSCDTEAKVEGVSNINGNIAGTVNFSVVGPSGARTDLCISEVGRAGTTWFYRQTTGQVSSTTSPFTC